MIKNKEALLSHGFVEGRRVCLEIMEHALRAVDPYAATKKHVHLEGNQLRVDTQIYDLNQVENIYVIGAGKATYRQALAMDEILGDRITDGFVVVKYGQQGPLQHIRIMEAAHPVPDENGYLACREVMRLAERATEKDLVFCLMSGGSSATCYHPVDGIDNADKITMNRLLVHCGAQITEIMAVRRHLSKIKGGRLAKMIQPATAITLTVSDAIGDPLEWNADWTCPDSSTFKDAVAILHKYDLWEQAPAAVQDYFAEFAPEKETPKAYENWHPQYYMTVKTRDLWEAAYTKARELGVTPHVITTSLKGESREVGRVLACIAKEIQQSGMPFRSPCVLIAAGETGVRVHKQATGAGGANQEIGCGGCLDLEPGDPIVIAALDTDGTDGPTEIAGALTDGTTVQRAREQQVDFYRGLMDHNSSELLRLTGDFIETGHTGTNVNDLVLVAIL